MIQLLLQIDAAAGKPVTVVLLGAGGDRVRNERVAARYPRERVRVVDTDASVLRFAAVIKRCDLIVTSDSLALHLAISQGIPFVAFFAPTSAAEIDDFGLGYKVVSLASDYCSYSPLADNRTITAERLYGACEIVLARLRRHAWTGCVAGGVVADAASE